MASDNKQRLVVNTDSSVCRIRFYSSFANENPNLLTPESKKPKSIKHKTRKNKKQTLSKELKNEQRSYWGDLSCLVL